MKSNTMIFASLFFSSMALSGCSSAPSSSDVQKALAEMFFGNKSALPEIGLSPNSTKDQVLEKMKVFKIVGCKPDETGASYNCTVSGSSGTPFEGKFTKTDHGWEAQQ